MHKDFRVDIMNRCKCRLLLEVVAYKAVGFSIKDWASVIDNSPPCKRRMVLGTGVVINPVNEVARVLFVGLFCEWKEAVIASEEIMIRDSERTSLWGRKK